MKYRVFPKIPDIKLSQFGMGLMRLPTSDGTPRGTIDRNKAAEMVERAISAGVNYFDTAHPYHGGDSQHFAAEYIVPRMQKDGLHLATKLPQWSANSYDDFNSLLNEQMEILGVDQIEFYLIHGFGDDSWPKHKENGVIDFLKEAIADKRIKYPCFSYHGSYDVFKEVIDAYDGWIFAQIMLNYVDEYWQAGKRGMEYAYAKDVGIVVMEPLKGGMLVNELPAEAIQMFKDRGLSPVNTAMDWCYSFKEPTVVLSGVSSLEQTLGQIDIANSAGVGGLTEAEMEVIEYVKSNFTLVPCSACQYCQPCPFGVHIPDIISMYNEHTFFGRDSKKQYQQLVQEGHGADQCTECGACEEVCPQSIEIISVLKEAHSVMAK